MQIRGLLQVQSLIVIHRAILVDYYISELDRGSPASSLLNKPAPNSLLPASTCPRPRGPEPTRLIRRVLDKRKCRELAELGVGLVEGRADAGRIVDVKGYIGAWCFAPLSRDPVVFQIRGSNKFKEI